MSSCLSLLNKYLTMGFVCVVMIAMSTSALAFINSSVNKKIIVKGAYGSLGGEIGYWSEGDSWAAPTAITVDSDGNIYIADIVNDRIVKFDKNGKFKFKIAFDVLNRRYSGIVSDLATDLYGNLYIASRHERKIYKYTSDGKLVFLVDLEEKNICTSTMNKWYTFAFQIMGVRSEYDCNSDVFELNLDRKGNIYLKGLNWLVKFDAKGKVAKKIASKDNSLAYFLDELSNLYVRIKADDWEKYDSAGLSLGPIKCSDPILGKLCGRYQYPMFIDKSGFIYSFADEKDSSITKKDIHGRYFGEYKLKRQYPDGFIKFDANGNLYILDLGNNQFSIKKVSWD